MKALVAVLFAALLSSARGQEPAVQNHHERLGPAPVRSNAPALASPKNAGQTAFTNFLRITNRETSRQFYNLVFNASEGVPMEWSGSYAGSGTPGTNSAEYLRAVLRRVNYYRAMAGVPSTVTFNSEYSRKAQLAALMMGGNNRIDHFPDPTWKYYTADGAEAAQSSNLSLGHAGPQSVMGQMRDNGGNNAAAGHRRWILYPQTRVMGAGNVPEVGTNSAAGVLWVFDDHYLDPRPATRENYVAWPPPGFVPHQVVYARWSFSYPGADFSTTTISMTSNGVSIAVWKEPVSPGAGENTVVWIPADWNENSLVHFPKPAADTTYRVTLNNVRINGTPQTFVYDVVVFDPAVPGAGYFPAVISGSTNPVVNASNVYTFTAVSNATGYEFRQSRLTNTTFVDGFESGLGNFIVDAATNLYNVRDNAVKFAGTYSAHLTHTQAVSQTLTLNRTFLATSNSAVQFRSRLGYATVNQFARVQVSLDGVSWSDLYAQNGNSTSGEAGFTLRTASLTAFAGRTVRLRLNYDFTGGNYFPQASTGVGWYIDDFTVTNALELLSSSVANANTNRTFGFAPAQTGAWLLEVRQILFGDYRGEWGTAFQVNAVPDTSFSVRINGISKAAPNTWHIDFRVLSGSPASFELWSSQLVTGPYAKETAATIQTISPGVQYRAVVTSATTTRFFQIKPLP